LVLADGSERTIVRQGSRTSVPSPVMPFEPTGLAKTPPEPPGIDIVGYRVIATREDPLRVYQVELPASARSVPIPAAFLQSGTEYELEIQAIEESGNWTFSTSTFFVK